MSLLAHLQVFYEFLLNTSSCETAIIIYFISRQITVMTPELKIACEVVFQGNPPTNPLQFR